MSERRNGGGAPPSTDDLRSTIAGALAESLAETPPAGEEAAARAPARRGRSSRLEPGSAGPAEAPAAPAAAGGESGETAQTAGEPPARPSAEPTGGPGPGEQPGEASEQPGAEEPPAGVAPEAPQHWSAADKEKFNALPEAARGPFLDMYKRMEGAFTQRLQRSAQLERDYGELDRTIFTAVQRDLIARQGATPTSIITAWANIERALDRTTNPSNPQLRHEIIARIIHNYGADPGEVAKILNRLRGFPEQQGDDGAPATGGPAPNGATAPGPAAPQPAPGGAPPANGLEARLSALETDYNTRVANERQAQTNEINRQIADFANANGADGNLLHPYFAEVEQDMAILAQLDRAQGGTPQLQDLYDRAVWARPSTREKLLGSQRDAEAKRAAEERKAKAEAAKRAAVSVSGAPGPGQAPQTNPDRSLRDEIRANLDATGRG